MKKVVFSVNIRARLLAYFLFVAILPLFILAITSTVMINSSLNDKLTQIGSAKIESLSLIDNLKLENRKLISQITLLAAIAGITLAYLLAIYITKPLSIITEAANDIENGDFSKRVNMKSKDELGFLAQSFNKMAIALQKRKELEQFRDDFVATLTHDLRVPLLASVQTLEQLRNGSYGGVTEKQNFILSQLASNNKDILNMVNTILDSYKYEAGKQTLFKSNMNLNKLIEKSIIDITPLALQKGHNITFMSDKNEKIDVFVDSQEIKRVITNLLSNAISYTKDDGKIAVEAKIQNDKAVVSIKDNGIGISQDSIHSLFERYSKGSKTLRKIGTGLGLYLSKQIIQAHNGEIWVESIKDEGSTFYFSIPLTG